MPSTQRAFEPLTRASVLVATLLLLTVVSSVGAWSEPFVAGLLPDRRPEAAPRITRAQPSDGDIEIATKGIDRPLPPLSFLRDHGGWYTPFTRPGMPGPYDIRGLHQSGQSQATAGPPSAPAAKPR